MTGPHQDQEVVTGGAPFDRAEALVLLVHGRGATARSILGLGSELDVAGVAFAAPQAAGMTWYPNSFLAPLGDNEPGRSSGLASLGAVLARAEEAGVASERQLLLGFSQGACLALEYAARHPRRYGGVVGLTGGLLGPTLETGEYVGDLRGTPVFLGSGDPDPHVPWPRVEETGKIFTALGAKVDIRRYPGLAHTINREELTVVRSMIDTMLAAGAVADDPRPQVVASSQVRSTSDSAATE